MSKENVESHGFTVGGYSPYHRGHHTVVQQMKKAGHTSSNVFATQSGRRPISAEKKVDYIQTAVGKDVNVSTTQTPFHAAAQLHKEGKRGKLVFYGGSDRADIADRLREYNGKEGKHGYYKFDSIEFKKVGEERKEGAKGIAGFSGTAARKSKNPQELKKFLPKELHPRAKEIFNDMNESTNPIGIFLLGGPGSGKDYVLKNIFSRFDLTEVQADQILNGAASELLESNKNIVINGANDAAKIEVLQNILEGYTFDFVHVSVSNKVSRLRNELRNEPIAENKRIDKFLKAEQLATDIDAFVFNNSINLNESSDMEKLFFASQIEKLLEKVVELGLEIQSTKQIKTFVPLKEKVYMPAKYKTGNEKTDAARASHWKRMSKYSDRDPRAYKDAPGDKKARKEGLPLSKHTIAVRKMMAKEEAAVEPKVRRVARTGNITAVMNARKETGRVDEGDNSIAAKAKKSGISVGTLRKVYNRGVAAWNSGHRPGTTPQQWGHARVNSYINKGTTYHTADKDLRKEEVDIDELFEMQLMGTDEYRKHAIAMTPGQNQEIENAFKPTKEVNKKQVDIKQEETDCCSGEFREGTAKSFRDIRKFQSEAKSSEEDSTVDTTPTLQKDKKTRRKVGKQTNNHNSNMDGLPVVAGALAEVKKDDGFMPTPRQVPGPQGGHPVPPGYERVKSWGGAYELRKIKEKPTTVKEAVEYHIENQVSFTDNIFRPGSEMFFEMIAEAKRLYNEGKYTPTDEFELDMLNSDIGEIVEYEGEPVVLDYPIEEGLDECWTGYVQKGMKKKGDKMVPNCVPVNEEDKTNGKGIGKPWREGGGGAVYVRTGDGGIKKVRFSQSGMKKRFNEPGRVRSFVARHHCLTNKDKTSASYWACRWPRFFSNSGKIWW